MNSQFYKTSESLFRCEAFEQWPWLKHGFGTRHSEAYYAVHPVVTLRQTHSNLVRAARGIRDRACEGDALITDEPAKRIGVRTADCVPILLVDPVTHSVAAVHAGWRGTVADIAGRAVHSLAGEFGARAHNIHVALGPSIRVCCYEVGQEVASQFGSILPGVSYALDGPLKIDLIEANRRILVRAGIPAEQIYDSGLCTYCMPQEFFSYRREPHNPGRLLSFIQITEAT